MGSRTGARADPRLIGAAALASVVVDAPFSWRPSLWTDEAATISAGARSLPELRAMAGNIDAVHATYYAFMHLWLTVFPAEAFFLRLPSLLAVAAATVGVYLIGCRLADQRIAVASTLVFVLLPRTTWMAIEARPYAFSALLAVAGTWLLLTALDPGSEPSVRPRHGPPVSRRPQSRTVLLLVAYAVLMGLGVAVHIYVALLLVAHGISLLLTRTTSWSFRLGWVVAGLGATALASPVVWTAVHQTGQLGGGAFGPVLFLRNAVVNQWFLGETSTLSTGAGSGTGISLATLWKLAAVALAGLCWLLVAYGIVRRTRSARLLVWALPWIVVPTVVIGGYSMLVHNMYNPRYFSYATAGLALLVGHGLVALGRRRLVLLALVLILVGTAPVYVAQRQLYAKSSADWVSVAAFVQTHRAADQGVYFSPRNTDETATVAQTARGVQTAYPAAFAGLRDVTLLRTPVQDANLTGTSLKLAGAVDRLTGLDGVWVVRRRDYPFPAADDQILAGAGFQPGISWSGPLDTVILFSRPAS